jgi:hypothetical protein
LEPQGQSGSRCPVAKMFWCGMRIWWEENNLDGIEIFEREVVREGFG